MESAFIAEVIDPQSREPVPRGQAGELVLTNLGRLGSPLIRYRTGDMVQTGIEDACECGTTDLALVGGILGRTDDMVVVRGVNVYPSAVDDVLRASGGVAEYRVEVRSSHAMAELLIQVEPTPEHAGDPHLAHKLELALRNAFALRIPVQLVAQGLLPRFEMKAKRWERV
jgi:phenylacetate-CoA ligase